MLFHFAHMLAILVKHTNNSINACLTYNLDDTSIREMCYVIESFFNFSGINSSAIILEALALMFCMFKYKINETEKKINKEGWMPKAIERWQADSHSKCASRASLSRGGIERVWYKR
jgi:hypothetical protein